MLPRLGVNIDHIATLRQLRGTPYPSVLEAALAVERAGGQQITVHLREDRRHIQDEDVRTLRANLNIPLNLEMAANDEMVRYTSKVRPDWVCLVPEKRQEVTTEGGLDLNQGKRRIAGVVSRLRKAGVRVSLFIEPEGNAVRISQDLGADAVELHTGRFGIASQSGRGGKKTSLSAAIREKRIQKEVRRIEKAGLLGKKLGIHVHAGHGLDTENVRMLAELVDLQNPPLPLIEEYNIGHSIVCRAALVGMERAVREMISAILAP